MKHTICNIAIDGPAGAGKSTIAKKVAKELSFIYVDTGAMYRAMALYMIRQGINKEEPEKIAACAGEPEISIEYTDGVQTVLLNGENVNSLIRREEVGEMASVSSAVPQVRAHLLDLQRGLAAKQSVVMDGRDIGTTILPGAQVKIYLTASAETRAKRRCLELEQKGESPDYETVKQMIEERDERDKSREISPLKQAEDAVLVDSSDMTIDEVVEAILKITGEKMACR